MVSDALEEEVPIFEFVLTNDGAGHNLMIFEQDIRNVMMIKEHSQVEEGVRVWGMGMGGIVKVMGESYCYT